MKGANLSQQWDYRTKGGYDFREVTSAFQKSVRRGMVDDALYWAVELYSSGYDEYLWKRMKLIASEDIGLANPHLQATIRALYENFSELKKKKERSEGERLYAIHAVLLITRSPKNRMCDDALTVAWNLHKERQRPIPDYALDVHTPRGRQMGRGGEHFYAEGAKLEPLEGDNPYLAEAMAFDEKHYAERVSKPREGENGLLFPASEEPW